MQILRGDIYLLGFLLPFDVLLKCKNIELAIIIAFGLLLMTPKESLAVILSTASSTHASIGAMQNADETKQLLLHHYADSSASGSSSGSSNKSPPGGLIRCSNKLKCFDLNSALRMRNGGQLSAKDTYEYQGRVGKFSGTSRHLRVRRDHATSVIDTPSSASIEQQQYVVQAKLMKNITQERSQQISSNHTANNQHRHHGGADDLINLKNSLEDLRNNSSSQGKETSVDSTHSSYNGFLKLIFFISIIFVILLIIIASIIYIWVIRRFSTNLEQINRRLPEVNHNLLNHSIQDFEALMLSVQNLGCAGMERLGSPPSNFATSCSPQRDNRSIRRPTTIPIMQHDLKVSSNRQSQQSNNSSKAQQQRQQCCYNNLNSGINYSQHHPSSDGNYHHRNNHQYTSCTSNNCPTHIQHPQHDGEFSRRIPSLDQSNDEIKRTYIQGPPNKTIQDVPDASNSHLPAYASLRYNSNIHKNNVNLCNNNLSNQKPSNNQQPHNNHHSSSSSQCRNDKMRKTSSNFLLDKLKFLRANTSSTTTNVKSASVDYKTHGTTAAPISHQKSNPIMVHSTFPAMPVAVATTTAHRCAIPQQPSAYPQSTAPQTEEPTERNIMFNGSTNINFSPTSSATLKVSSSSSSASSLLSQTLSYSSDCHGDANDTL